MTTKDVAQAFKGLIMPIPTVFDGQGEVDLPTMEILTDWYLGKGVHGFFVLGSHGQGPSCRIDQRKQVAETVVKRVKGRVPIVVQVGAVDPYTTAELARHARDVGADGIGVVGPYYYNDRTEWEFIEHHRMVDAAAGMPMFLYNNPDYSGYPTSAGTMKKLREQVPNVFGAKLAKGNLEQALQYRRVLGDQFSLFIPISGIPLGLQFGVRGSIASGPPVTFPEIAVRLVEAIWGENFELARRLQLLFIDHSNRTAPLRKYGRSSSRVGLQSRGLPVKQYPRWPTQPIPAEDQKLMENNIKQTLEAFSRCIDEQK